MLRRLFILSAAWLVASAFAAHAKPTRPGDPPATDAPKLAKALADVLAGKLALDDVRLDVHWAGNADGSAATVYGNSIGIWSRAKQFTLAKEQILDLLRDLDK